MGQRALEGTGGAWPKKVDATGEDWVLPGGGMSLYSAYSRS
ncbi:hypothetical protein RintRC_1393 [Richelia intracellularis]|nr:hypothetical protein RintRC_1393 [Richelia intracellularis]